MGRYGRAVALALLAWPGTISRAGTPSQSHSWRGVLTCATFRPLLKNLLGSHFTCFIFLYDKDLPQLTAIIFPLPPVSFAAGSC